MATHNSVRLVGYLLEDPTIANEGQKGAEKIFIKLRTIRRDADDVDPQRYEDIYVFYDGIELIEKMKKLVRFDLIDIKGVFNIVATNKPSRCPDCGAINFRKNGTYSFVYPQWVKKIDNILNSFEYKSDLPDSILFQQYKEVSNYLTLIGTVVSKPELLNQDTNPLCRYRVGVDRKYYIKTQPDITADYPWIYTRGQQAIDDARHLDLESVVLVDGYIHTRNVHVPTKCEACGANYSYPDVVTDFIPYAIEYLNKYKTDEDIARDEELALREMIANVAQ